jgi:glutathione S-transferase
MGEDSVPEELVFYTNPMSRGRIVHWMLEEVGEPFRLEYLGYGGPMNDPGYLDVNPLGKVPAIRHGKRIVTECAAICAYLADAFPEAGLAPPPPERADYYRWLFFASGPLEAAVVNRSLGFEIPEERRGAVGYAGFERMMDALESAVAGKTFVAGDRFSAADVYVGSQIGWGLRFGTMEDRPAFREYWERVSARPAYARAAAKDDAATPPRTG